MMTFEEAKDVFLNRGWISVENGVIFDGNKWRESVQVVSEWLEQQPCKDCISREAVLELVADYDLSMGQVVKGIHALPPVTPQQKVGRWNKKYDSIVNDYFWECDICKCGFQRDYPYCPNCGAKMQEVEE